MIPFPLQAGQLGRGGRYAAIGAPPIEPPVAGSRWRASDVSSPLSLTNSDQRLVLAANNSSIAKTVAVDAFKSTGKWYAEVKFVHIYPGGTTTNGAGIAASTFAFGSSALATGTSGNDAVGVWPDSTGSTPRIYRGGGFISGIGINEPGDGDIIMLAMDVDARKLWVGINGTWHNSGDPGAGTGETIDSTYLAASKSWAPAASPWSSEVGAATTMDILSGSDECQYSLPSGFSYW